MGGGFQQAAAGSFDVTGPMLAYGLLDPRLRIFRVYGGEQIEMGQCTIIMAESGIFLAKRHQAGGVSGVAFQSAVQQIQSIVLGL